MHSEYPSTCQDTNGMAQRVLNAAQLKMSIFHCQVIHLENSGDKSASSIVDDLIDPLALLDFTSLTWSLPAPAFFRLFFLALMLLPWFL